MGQYSALGSTTNLYTRRSMPLRPPYFYFRFRHTATPITLSVEEFSFRLRRQYFCLLRARVYRNDIGRYSERAFFVGAHFEILTISSSGRTGCVRSMKLSGIIALRDPTRHTRHGAPPSFGFAARGRKRIFFRSRFSPQRLEISTPFFHYNMPLWGRYTAPLNTMG